MSQTIDTDHSYLIRNSADISQLISKYAGEGKTNKVIWLALIGVFIDAYDLTTLSFGIEQVISDFSLTPVMTGVVASAIIVGTIVGNLLGGWLTDKIGRYRVFMADMVLFVIAAIVAGLAPNVWVLIAARFVMGISVGIDLPVAMSYLAEFSKFSGKSNKAARLAAWCPMWYAASSTCFAIVLILYFILPADYAHWLWRISLIFGAVPAIFIIFIRGKYLTESPIWLANQGDLKGAAKILRDSYDINAYAAVDHVEKVASQKTQGSFKVLFNQVYLSRTIVAIVIHISVAFQYTTIAFFLPSILTRFFHTDTLTTITTTLGLNLAFAFTGGLLGVYLASRLSSRFILLSGFLLQFIALIFLGLVGEPANSLLLYFAIAMLGLWLFAEGFGPGAQMMVYPTMAYPASIRGVGVGMNRAVSGVAQAIALFVLPIWMAKFTTDVFLLISLFAAVPLIVIGLMIKFEPTKQDVDANHSLDIEDPPLLVK
ncbi:MULTISPECIES: MFS transporter [unclassified Acinetobacter]|uniref:MFS transporter n=1 Tax=unclassified Acinetobacter TaxID=196816 RepID=UPI002934B966|nr:MULTISPECIES: MFS transporter [unclassified Acinetobacter]WOE32472.1 MFS transporter [Acinetobacter sp. SAAs470]WOE37948.1 MFS transporter [Acinetobacter sp. SAAs474]